MKNPTIIAGLFLSLSCLNFKDMAKIMQIPLTKGQVALVDKADFKKLNKYNWQALKRRSGNYSARAWDKATGKDISMHRLILGLTDPKVLCDHKDGNPLNNCRNNLRPCTNSQNNFNSRKGKNHSSKYKGVIKKGDSWRARIGINHRCINLGYFKVEEDAAIAYNKAAKKLFKEFANLNIIT